MVTAAPARGPPEVSSTWNTTVEVADPPALPTPFNVIVDGVAEMNEMEPIAAWATVTVPLAVKLWLLADAVAVITSLPLHPVAEYVALALPVLVVTVGLVGVTPAGVATIVARPWAWQGELNVTAVGVV
jgi:hypothetical protein